MASLLPISDIDRILNNPSLIQRYATGYLRDLYDGTIEFVDPSNPAINILECAASLTANAVGRFEVGERQVHAIQAVDPKDVYVHMTDLDFIDRFAQPNEVPMLFVFNLDEIRTHMVEDSVNGYRKITIPKDTEVRLNDYTFRLIYDVEIREMRHGGITVVYAVDELSPLMSLETNQITPYYSNSKTDTYISIPVKTLQVDLVRLYATVSPSTIPSVTYTLKDQYYYAEVFIQAENGDWAPLRTTHSERYYDPKTPTAVISVIDRQVKVTIPHIYVQSQSVIGKLRVDLYETKGPMTVDLGLFDVESFVYTTEDVLESKRDVFNQALAKLNTKKVYSDKFVIGGRDALSMEDLRDRVIKHITGPKQKPITPDEIRAALVDRGYEIIKNVDNLTRRTFLASRLLPTPNYSQLITAASLSIQTVTFAIDEAIATGNAVDNGSSVMLLPSMTYSNQAGITKFVQQTEVDRILALPNDKLAIEVNANNFYRTPFHYLLEYNQHNEFDVRAYYLDNPQITSKLFIRDNPTTHMSVNTGKYTVKRTDQGYRITLVTSSDQEYKNLMDQDAYAQIAYKQPGDTSYVYLNGTYKGRDANGERIFEFDVVMNYYIDEHGYMDVLNFHVDSEDTRKTQMVLNQDFEVFYLSSGFMHPEWTRKEIDNLIGRFILPTRIAGLNQERITIHFGDVLESLWKRARNVPTEKKYLTYTEDVYETYLQDVYEVDSVTNTPVIIDQNGKPTFNILHHKGDVKLDDDGNPRVLYVKGNVKLDANGLPIVANERQIGNQIDILLVDGTYWFSNDTVAINYRQEFTRILVDWIMNDLTSISPSLLEKTNIYFYPKTTTGQVDVMFGPGHLTSVNANQELQVLLHVSKTVYADTKLRDQLKTNTIKAINDYFTNDVISISELTDQLRGVYGGDVIDVKVTGLGGEANNFPVLTIMHDTNRLSIGKQLTNRPDGVLVVEESITVEFIRHGKDAYSDSY